MFINYNEWCEWYYDIIENYKVGDYVTAIWNGQFMEYEWSLRAAELFKYPRVPLKKGDKDVT